MIFKVEQNDNNWILVPVKERFELPPKIYGNIKKVATRVWNDFSHNRRSTGLLLTGRAGAGKTLCGQVLANIMIDNNIPVVLIEGITPDDKFPQFLAGLNNCGIFIDEFGKMFQWHMQNKLLTILSDIYSMKRLFILTDNAKEMINEFIKNRPGRIRYRLDFDFIHDDIIKEVCEDNGVSPEATEGILKIGSKSSTFTYDHLSALVTEHLKYPNDTIEEITSYLNIDIRDHAEFWFVVEITNEQGEPVRWNGMVCKESLPSNGSMFSIEINDVGPSLWIGEDYFVHRKGNTAIYKTNGYTITLERKTTNEYNANPPRKPERNQDRDNFRTPSLPVRNPVPFQPDGW